MAVGPELPPRWGRLDLILLALLGGLGLWFGLRVSGSLAYQWNWSAIPQYLLRHDPSAGWQANLLLQGLAATVRLSAWSLLVALPLGLAAGLLRVSPWLFNRLLGTTWVNLFRNLPPLVLIFIGYFFVSDQVLPLLGIGRLVTAAPPALQTLCAWLVAPPDQVEAFIAGVLTLACYEAAYIAEIVRAGISAVESGQWQAAQALGMRRWQLLRHVVLPQAFKRSVPPLAGQFISTIKDSAIVAVISIQELTFQGMELMAATYHTFEIWLTVAALYFLLTFTCSRLSQKLEKHLLTIS
ncbi:MAG: amino acid ABC transporter permease [Geothermobacteraceae bacterium]